MRSIKKIVVFCLLLNAIACLIQAQGTQTSYSKKELLLYLVRLNDKNLPDEWARQSTQKDNRYYGAVFDKDSVVSPIATAHLIQSLTCGYVSPQSTYYRSKEILDRMILAARAIKNLQHPDGTIDLLSTNFHSTPDLGFTIFPMALSYGIILKNKQLDFGELQGLMKQYLQNAGRALSVGGIHTPNHRWVVASALASLHKLIPNAMYKLRIDEWLAEKIDIDPDGQYHEKSTAVYTPITNRSLLEIARKLDYPSLYDVVRRNLDLTFYFVHANGEIVTESSTRQDKYLRSNMAGYYLAYNFMALLDKDIRYAGMARYIQHTVPVDQLGYMLPYFIDDASLLQELPEGSPLPTQYHKIFTYSNMVRIREGNVDMSVISNNSNFFTYFKGEAALEGVRLSSAFFGKGQFEAQHLERTDNGYVLSAIMDAPYLQPLSKDKIPINEDAWSQIPKTERTLSEIQTLNTKVYVSELNGKARIRIVVDGPKNLPVTLELAFRKGGILRNVISKGGIDDAFLIKDGAYATYQKGDDIIKVGPGLAAHKWTQLRGALPKLPADCLYFTQYAPCEFEFTVE